jgi:hypothetical protein
MENAAESTFLAGKLHKLPRAHGLLVLPGKAVNPRQHGREIETGRIDARRRERYPQGRLAGVFAKDEFAGWTAHRRGLEGLIGQAISFQAGAVNAGLMAKSRGAQDGFAGGDVASGSGHDQLPSGASMAVATPLFRGDSRSSAITTSSRAALPARSPKPATVTSTDAAPASMALTAFAVAMPKSLWAWKPIAMGPAQ